MGRQQGCKSTLRCAGLDFSTFRVKFQHPHTCLHEGHHHEQCQSCCWLQRQLRITHRINKRTVLAVCRAGWMEADTRGRSTDRATADHVHTITCAHAHARTQARMHRDARALPVCGVECRALMCRKQGWTKQQMKLQKRAEGIYGSMHCCARLHAEVQQ